MLTPGLLLALLLAPAPTAWAQSSFDFGAVCVSSSEDGIAKSLTADDGTGSYQLSDAFIFGSNAGDFQIVDVGCPSLTPSPVVCDISVRFTPSGPGLRQATLKYTWTQVGDGFSIISGSSVQLTGTGEIPTIECPPNVGVDSDPNLCGAYVGGVATAGENCDSPIVVGLRDDNKLLTDLYPIGQTTIHWTATDASGNQASCSQMVTVYDKVAPAISRVSVSPNVLRTADHSMRDVTVNYTAADLCGASTCTLSASSSEPDNGLGDGDTAGDIQIVDNHHVRLRAERSGTGNGRTYTITITCTDASGNRTQKSVPVSVPKN